jgi:hypothetical protein
MSAPRLGAYGFALRGLSSAASLVAVPDSWPELELVRRTGDPGTGSETLDDEQATLVLQSGGTVEIQRDPARAVFTTPRELGETEIVHPLLAPVAAVVARWMGRESLHAGAFVHDGGAWALVGDRESGKSSMLAWLALNGTEIVTDDVLVVDGKVAFAGPRSLDLREEPAARLAAGEHVGVVGSRDRWRLLLGPAQPQLPLRGWVLLGWGERLEARRIAGGLRIPELMSHRALNVPPARPETLLELATLPAWELRRPRDWSSLDAAADRVLETLAA